MNPSSATYYANKNALREENKLPQSYTNRFCLFAILPEIYVTSIDPCPHQYCLLSGLLFLILHFDGCKVASHKNFAFPW
jgi:hypothetical protein